MPGASETDWEVELIIAGTTPTGVATDFATGTPLVQVSPLAPNQSYEFLVRSNCGGEFSGLVSTFHVLDSSRRSRHRCFIY